MKKIIVFGASASGVKRSIRNINFKEGEVVAFLDNDVHKWGTTIQREPFINAQVIGIDSLSEYDFDYIAVAILRYAKECLNQLLEKGIPREKILLVCDDSIWPIMLEVESFGNSRENSNLFTNHYYEAYDKLLKCIWAGYDKDKHVFRFRDLEFSDGALCEQDVFLAEFRDLLQEYVLGRAITPFNEGPYERGSVVLQEGDVVFDCGANIGMFTAYAADKVGSGGRVYALEPYDKAREELVRNTARYSNVSIVPKAVADKRESVQMSVGNQIGNSSIISDMSGSYMQVETDTIDNIVEEYQIERLDFIKADIEGAERNMLWGARETIARCKPRISICTYHLEDDKEMLEAIIKYIDKDYIVEHKWRKLFAWVPQEQPAAKRK